MPPCNAPGATPACPPIALAVSSGVDFSTISMKIAATGSNMWQARLNSRNGAATHVEAAPASHEITTQHMLSIHKHMSSLTEPTVRARGDLVQLGGAGCAGSSAALHQGVYLCKAGTA